MIRSYRWFLALLMVAAMAVPLSAQDTGSAPPPAPAQDDDPDRDPNDSQPDFYVATLATNLRLPKGKMNFRVTHRFLRPLGEGDFGDLAARAFGLDGGAQIGLDLKYGLFRGAHVGVYRTSDRTIQFSGHYNAVRDADGPIGLGVLVSVEGTNNFSDDYSPALALVVSKELGDRGAVYVQPAYIDNTNFSPEGDDFTVMTGLGIRARIARNAYLFLEASPRLAGYDPGVTFASFGFEQRYGGHVFQLNVSNGFGTTLGQVARGGVPGDNWYLGFNLTRKFY